MLLSFILLIFYFNHSYSLNNGLALTPPMGFLSWGRYRCVIDCDTYPDECISEKLFRNVADIFVEEGYRDAGYEYIVIDDCWLERTRDHALKLQADKKRFPRGIQDLARYTHSKGLKLGIYENYGKKTCMGYPGSLHYLKFDAELFASWEVDYIKLDGCFSNPYMMDIGFPEFGKYLNQTGRPIVYSCSWPYYQELKGMIVNYTAIAEHCNLWRSYDDIENNWSSILSVMDDYAFRQNIWQQHVGPGHWNDPDMLMIGNGLEYEQSKSHMAIWAIMAAPLFLSTDLTTITPQIKSLLQNKQIIAVNQDSLGIPGKRMYKEKNIEIWVKKILPVCEGYYYSYAIVVFNRKLSGQTKSINVTLESIGLLNPFGYTFLDLLDEAYVTEKFVKTPKSKLHAAVKPSGVKMYRATSNCKEKLSK